METLFSGIISSKTRIKLLVRLFMNPGTQSYMRQLASEFGLSTNAVREELNQLSATKLIKSHRKGKRVLYQANRAHPLFPELKSMVAKALGIDQVVDGIIARLGNVELQVGDDVVDRHVRQVAADVGPVGAQVGGAEDEDPA